MNFIDETVMKRPHAWLASGLNVSVMRNPEALRQEWIALEQSGLSSLFQSYSWCSAWHATASPEEQAQTAIVVGRGPDQRLLFVLPFQVRRRFGVRVLEWMSSPLASNGYGVYDLWCVSREGQEWLSSHFYRILNAAGEYDAIALRDMPVELNGHAHPLSGLMNVEAPNKTYYFPITQGFDSLLSAKRSSESRKNIRWRDNKLTSFGRVGFSGDHSPAESRQALNELFSDQAARLAESGVADPFGARERTFFDHMLQHATTGSTQLKVYRLSLDGTGLSSILAAFHNDVCVDLLTSLADTTYRKYSPGDLVLRRLIKHCCETGVRTFDLSIGVADYKLVWCDQPTTLRCILLGKTPKGLAFAGLYAAEQVFKGFAKKSPLFRNAYFEARRWLKGKR